MTVFYEVVCRFDDEAHVAPFVAWLRGRHVGDVLAAGALRGEILLPHGAGAEVRVLYTYPSDAALAAYEEGPASELRAESLAFLRSLGAEGKVSFARARGALLVP
jgi:hypothetical protein